MPLDNIHTLRAAELKLLTVAHTQKAMRVRQKDFIHTQKTIILMQRLIIPIPKVLIHGRTEKLLMLKARATRFMEELLT